MKRLALVFVLALMPITVMAGSTEQPAPSKKYSRKIYEDRLVWVHRR